MENDSPRRYLVAVQQRLTIRRHMAEISAATVTITNDGFYDVATEDGSIKRVDLSQQMAYARLHTYSLVVLTVDIVGSCIDPRTSPVGLLETMQPWRTTLSHP